MRFTRITWVTGAVAVSLNGVSALAAPQVQGTLTTLRMVGDANGDGVANNLDLQIVQANQGKSGGLSSGDFDNNGLVNAADLTLINTHLNKRMPAINLGRILDTATPVPASSGNFTLLNAPAVDAAGNMAFLGSGPATSGVYKWSSGVTSRVADMTTAIPSGTSTFDNFSGPTVAAGKVMFQGLNATNFGIYSSTNGVLAAVVNKATPRPEGSTFATINDPLLTSSAMSFVGANGSGTSAYSVVGSTLTPAVNTTTPIPGGTGNFASFDNTVSDGSNFYFIGRAVGQVGIYKKAGAAPITALLDRNSTVAGTTMKFSAISNLSESANNLSFFAKFGGISGIFALANTAATTPVKVADTNTPIPGANAKFAGFGVSAVGAATTPGGPAVAFVGYDANPAAPNFGIYAWVNGALNRVIDSSVTIGGKVINSLELSRSSVVGDRVVFQAIFSDFSSGIYSASLLPTRLAGDLNADGVVNRADYAILQNNLGGVGGYTRGDLNADGSIDFKDLQLMEKDFGKTGFAPLVGDTDNDGKVDKFDYRLVLGNQGKFGSLAQGDVNGDGSIDFADIQLVEQSYGRTAVNTYQPFGTAAAAADAPAESASVSGVPEPTTIGLASLTLLLTLSRRSRRPS